VAAFDLGDLFSGISRSASLQSWIATTDGKILFHPSPRFWNSSIENLRPIASANTAIASGQTVEPFEKFLAPDSQEVFGTWGVIPDLKFVVATEWRGQVPLVSNINPFGIFACGLFLALALASFVWSFKTSDSLLPPVDSSSSTSEFLNHQIDQ
jgi:hypothetical protein